MFFMSITVRTSQKRLLLMCLDRWTPQTKSYRGKLQELLPGLPTLGMEGGSACLTHLESVDSINDGLMKRLLFSPATHTQSQI